MKRILAILMISIMVLSVITFSIASTGFSDLNGHWAKDNIEKLSKDGIVNGYSNGEFKPEETVTYGEFIKMLVIAVTGENPGVATDGNHWANNYYEVAVENSILKENEIIKSYLDKSIPRADMAYLVANSVETVLEPEEAVLIEDYITDITKAGNRKNEVIYAYGTGILGGYPGGAFKPNGVLTRAESAAVISRITDKNLRLKTDFTVKPVEPVIPEVPVGEIPEITKTTYLSDFIKELPDSAKKPVNEVITNLHPFYADRVLYYYKLDKDIYGFYKSSNLMGEATISIEDNVTEVAFPGYSLSLVKDNKIIHYSQDAEYKGIRTYYFPAHEGTELPDFDYIELEASTQNTAILIPNPF